MLAVRDLERAARSFAALGFTLTPRGVHSIGSKNHCIMLASTYIELLEPSGTHPWLDYYRGFLESGEGLAALALATPDADAAYRGLSERGVAAQAPMDLARPVLIDGEKRVARFRLVTLSSQIFLCQHLTRELVWRREWQSHANGALDISAVRFPGDAPFEGASANIRWRSAGALSLKGLSSAVRAHGVTLSPG